MTSPNAERGKGAGKLYQKKLHPNPGLSLMKMTWGSGPVPHLTSLQSMSGIQMTLYSQRNLQIIPLLFLSLLHPKSRLRYVTKVFSIFGINK